MRVTRLALLTLTGVALEESCVAFTTNVPPPLSRERDHRVLRSTLNRLGGDYSESSAPEDDFDISVHKAYHAWRNHYGKEEYSPTRFRNFKSNYVTLLEANKEAQFKAFQENKPIPEPMNLNEYADLSYEEYQEFLLKMSQSGTEKTSEHDFLQTPESEQALEDAYEDYKAFLESEPAKPLSPERIRATYAGWCEFYGKPFDESRLDVFAGNLLESERYFKATGKVGRLNEYADLTKEEFRALQSDGAPAIASPQPDSLAASQREEVKESDPETARLRQVYADWLTYYGKTFDESRFPIFTTNYLRAEQYYMETGDPVGLNEYADLTMEEYQSLNTAQTPIAQATTLLVEESTEGVTSSSAPVSSEDNGSQMVPGASYIDSISNHNAAATSKIESGYFPTKSSTTNEDKIGASTSSYLETLAESPPKAPADITKGVHADDESLSAHDSQVKLEAEVEASKTTDEEARIKAEEETRRQAEEEARARAKAEEEARLQAKEETDLKAEEVATETKAEQEARLMAEVEAKVNARFEEARIKAEKAARIKVEEKARVIKTGLELRRKAKKQIQVEAIKNAQDTAKAEDKLSLSKANLEAKKTQEIKLVETDHVTKRTEEELAVLKVTLEEKKTAEVAEAKRQTERRALLKATLEAKKTAEIVQMKANEEARIQEEQRVLKQKKRRVQAEKQANRQAIMKLESANKKSEARRKAEEKAKAFEVEAWRQVEEELQVEKKNSGVKVKEVVASTTAELGKASSVDTGKADLVTVKMSSKEGLQPTEAEGSSTLKSDLPITPDQIKAFLFGVCVVLSLDLVLPGGSLLDNLINFEPIDDLKNLESIENLKDLQSMWSSLFENLNSLLSMWSS